MDTPKSLCQLQPLGLPAIKDRLDDDRRETCQRQKSADVGVRQTLLDSKVRDLSLLAVLDPPPGRAKMRLLIFVSPWPA